MNYVKYPRNFRLTEGMELTEDSKIDMAGKLYDELYKVKYQKKDGEG